MAANTKQLLVTDIAPITLADLKPEPVVMQVMMPYGRVVKVPIVPLTWHEWNTVGAQVLDPLKGNTDYWTKRNPATKEKEFDPENVAYLQALDEANSQRGYRRLLVALEKAGNIIEGNTLDEQIENLKAMEVGIAVALINKLGDISMRGRASVFALAESFRDERVPEAGGDAVQPEGVGPGEVGAPAG